MRSIHDNLQAVRERIARAALAAGRDPLTVALLAVSKTHAASLVAQAVDAGQRAFGENYVREALEKMDALAENLGKERARALEWHLIGPLQSNKTRLAAARFDWVHSVESEKVARRLSEQRPAGMAPLNVLIQVNVSGESSKSGVAPEQVAGLAEAISSLPNLKLRGLMAIPEPGGDVQTQRLRFSGLRKLLEQLQNRHATLDTLSMGMSDDMEAAIAEGATLVRIGTAIFGTREKLRPAA
ncbi:MAG: YggS family pyridoxal phosphate enzyme [Betaproteobacteria bacterium RBG_16_66_20]|nr:MAG: YggS family pyridoxal phosphate enzyme [Betaproteobacteria bacterium RBG_16_66_20]